jgi:hypothetical protein
VTASADNLVLPAWGFSNANVSINGVSTPLNRYVGSGTLKCSNFVVQNSLNGNITVKNDITNPNFEISGTIDLNGGVGTYTTIWTKGTGTITLTTGTTAATKTLDFDGQTIEDIIVNSTDDTDIKQLSVNIGAIDSLTVTDGKFDISTYNCPVTGATNVTGILVMGVSAGTGLTTAGLTFNSGSEFDLQTASIINNSGVFSVPNETIWTNSTRGLYTQTGSANVSNPKTGNYFYTFTVNAGVTATLNGNLVTSALASSSSFTLNGVLAMGSYFVIAGAGSTGSVTIGANGNFTGDGTLFWYVDYRATLSNSRASSFSFSGTVEYVNSSALLLMPAWDWSNADVIMEEYTVTDRTRYIGSDTNILKCKNFSVDSGSGLINTINCSEYDPDIVISGSIDFNIGSGTVVWVKGDGTITHVGTSGTPTCNFNNQNIEDFVINNSGVTSLTNQSNFTTDTLTFTDGKFNDGGYTITINGDISIAAIHNLLTSTGKWIQNANANFSNPRNTNPIHDYEANGDITLTSDAYIDMLILKTNKSITTGGSYKLALWQPDGNDPINIESGATYTGNLWLYPFLNLTQKALDQSGMDLRINYYGSRTVTATGNWTVKSLIIHGIGNNANIVDMDTYNLTCPDLYLGIPLALSGYIGYIKFGSGTHTITNVSRTVSDTSTTHKIDFETSTVNFSGNIDLTGILSNDNGGSSTINLVGTGSQSLTWNSQTIYDIDNNKSSGTATCVDTLVANKLTMSQGTLELKESVTNTIGNFEASGGSLKSASGGTQTTISLTNISPSSQNTTFQDIKVVGNGVIDAKDKTTVDGGGANTNTNNGNCTGRIFFNDFLSLIGV